MIKVVAKFIVQEDKIQVFKDRVVDLIEKTRQEEGNIFMSYIRMQIILRS